MGYHVTPATFAVFLLLVFITCCSAHGGMQEPPMRSLAWRYGFDVPINYDWNSLYCGGFSKFQQSGGKCGLCGDPYDGPFENDRGGPYDTGIIVRHYPAGMRQIDVKFELTAYHKGYVTFHLCPNNEMTLTQACFDAHPLQIVEGSPDDPYKFYPPENPKLHEVKVVLPRGVVCDRCVLQWIYKAGNSLGRHENGTSCIGCGLQETFINCADISIGGTVDNIFVRNDTNSPETDIVIPQTANVTQITDDAPSDSFEAVIRALRGFHQFVDRRFNAPGANVATQDSGMVGTRRGAGDHPGINPDQMNVPRNNLQGAGVNSRRVLPGLQPNRNRVPDLHGFPADQTQSIGRFHQTNLFPGHPSSIGRMSTFGDPNTASRSRNVDLPRPSSFQTVRDINLQDRRFNTLSRTDDSNQRQHVQNRLQRGRMTPLTMMVNPNGDPNRRSPNDRLTQGTFASDPNRQRQSVPNRSGLNFRTPIKRPNIQARQNLANPLERSNAHSSFIPSNSDTRNRFRTKSQQVQAGRMPVFSHRNSGFPPRTSHGSALGATSGLARNTQLHNRQRIPNGYTNAVVPPNEFGSQMNRMAWHRGDGRTSPRELVRHNSHLDTRDFSTTDIRQHVPQLSRNVELRQDGFPLLQRRQQQYMVPERENWFPNTPAFVQSRRLRAHSDRLRMRNGQSTPFSLPRRIEVDTINVAQHLLRKYPQLRGRVFLSRRGHLQNEYSQITNQYARRITGGQNW
ncbi:uncharacterized protein LOC128224429 [Mya arenaria]|uniref:uncharacterized protein LOC128224429 n=1 Tax=Mya arenaria TaxID=6604 RepID=UPI0022E26F42|nr:uncharacterized protein LOC128224429 [Mya arenaria]